MNCRADRHRKPLRTQRSLAREYGTLTELRHVGAQVVDPHFLGVAFVFLTTGEEQYIGLHALSVEDASGQAQDSVQVALVHEIGTDLFADVAFKEHVIWQHDGGATTGQEGTVDMLEEAELLVAGRKSEIITRRQPATFLGAKWRVGEDERCFGSACPSGESVSP